MRAPLRPAVVLAAAAVLLATATPARADTVLVHDDWSCAVPYSGELGCTPPLTVPPGGYLWIGEGDGGPTVFQVYRGTGAGRVRVGWTELRHGAGLHQRHRRAGDGHRDAARGRAVRPLRQPARARLHRGPHGLRYDRLSPARTSRCGSIRSSRRGIHQLAPPVSTMTEGTSTRPVTAGPPCARR